MSSEQLDQVMCEDNWPAGVRARPFLPKRTNQSVRQYREQHNANGDNNRPTRQAHGMHERRRPNIRVRHNDDSTGETYNARVMTRARETRIARNVGTTSAYERTDTISPPRTGTGPTHEDDRANACVITTRVDEIPTTTIHGTNTPDNTHITMTHVGYNAKGFKQSFMYVSELLSHADTVGITETWLIGQENCQS